MRRIVMALSALFIVLASGQVLAQAYPVKSIRFLVGYAPGGGTDIMARVVGAKLTESLGPAADRRQPAGCECQSRRGNCFEGDTGWLYGAVHFGVACDQQAVV